MTLRAGHGKGAGTPRIEILPCDELPDPIPADPVPDVQRDAKGRVSGAAAKALGSRGGKVFGRHTKLARNLGLPDAVPSEEIALLRKNANTFRKHHSAELAKMAGGAIGAAPASMIASAALQLAAARLLFAKAEESGDAAMFKTASALSNDSRQNLLAAFEIATRMAQARSRRVDTPWLESSAEEIKP